MRHAKTKHTREFTADDGILQPRFEMSFRDESITTSANGSATRLWR